MNLFAYVHNQPTVRVDPLGLQTLQECVADANEALRKCVAEADYKFRVGQRLCAIFCFTLLFTNPQIKFSTCVRDGGECLTAVRETNDREISECVKKWRADIAGCQTPTGPSPGQYWVCSPQVPRPSL